MRAGRDDGADGPLGRGLRLAVGFALFQGAWFLCVIGAARGQVALGIAAVAAVLGLHLAFSKARAVELGLIGLALAVGVVWDSLLARTGIVVYASPGPWAGWAPAWILALWALFAPMLREPLRWLHGRPLPAALVGGVGGALSYAAAARLGACELPDPTLALAVLGAGWALIVPSLLAAAQRLERAAARVTADPRACGVRT
ncbi:MAG: DUF2878 domain-containing protein [Burkholderiales bacterium]|nr:DUF2878 domain-containing protein [Burkholderiales bacterium]